jgi:hypothetical protein
MAFVLRLTAAHDIKPRRREPELPISLGHLFIFEELKESIPVYLSWRKFVSAGLATDPCFRLVEREPAALWAFHFLVPSIALHN